MNTEDSNTKNYSISELFSLVFFSLDGDTDERYKDFLNNLCQIKPRSIEEYHAIQKGLCYLAPLGMEINKPIIGLVHNYLNHTIGKNGYDYIDEIKACALDLMSIRCDNISDYLVIKDAVKLFWAIAKTVKLALVDEAVNYRPFAEPDYVSIEEGNDNNDDND